MDEPPHLNYTQIVDIEYDNSLYVNRTDLYYIHTTITYTCTHGSEPAVTGQQIVAVCDGGTDPPQWITHGECLRKIQQ